MANIYIDSYIVILYSFFTKYKTQINDVKRKVHILTDKISFNSKTNFNCKDILSSKLNSNDIIQAIEDNIYDSFKSTNVAKLVSDEIINEVIKDISELIDAVECCNHLKDEFEKNIKHNFSVADVTELINDINFYHEDKDISNKFNDAKQKLIDSYNKSEISFFDFIENIINTYYNFKNNHYDPCEDEDEYYYEDYDNNPDF